MFTPNIPKLMEGAIMPTNHAINPARSRALTALFGAMRVVFRMFKTTFDGCSHTIPEMCGMLQIFRKISPRGRI